MARGARRFWNALALAVGLVACGACGSLTGANDLTIAGGSGDSSTVASNDATTQPEDAGFDSKDPPPSDDAATDAPVDSAVVDAAPDHVVTCTSVSAYPSNISEPGGLASWDNLPTISSADGTYAESDPISTASSPSSSIVAADMRFAIPTDAVIQGIVVTMIRRAAFGGDIVDSTMRLRWGNSSRGDDRADPSAWVGSKKTITYGSATDVWGASMTPAIVNGADFGVIFAAKWIVGNSGNDRANIDSIQMTVHYCN